jgi:signal transduction histidine kinase
MRYGQKIFLMALALVTAALFAMGWMVILSSHSARMEQETARALREHEMVALSLHTAILYQSLQQDGGQEEDKRTLQAVKGVAGSLLGRNDAAQGVYIQLYQNGAQAFGDFPGDLGADRPELMVQGQECLSIFRSVGQKTYLLVASREQLRSTGYVLVSIRDASAIFEARSALARRMALIGTGVSVLVAAVLFLLTNLTTRRIFLIRSVSRRLADGEYSRRIPVRGRDELAELSEDFNAMAEAVEQNVKSLESVASDQRQFIDNLTHEMRTPLTSIIGFADLIRSTRFMDEATRADYAGSIYQEGQRLKALSGKLMELILLGRTEPDLQQVDVEAFLRELATLLSPMFTNRQMELRLSTEPATLLADPSLLQSLVVNLVDNACKASKPGQQVELSCYMDRRRRLHIEVADHGRGIPANEIHKIKQPFYMLDKARTRAEGGAGLGLALCSRIAELHHAVMNISSRVGQGTVVDLVFSREVAG